jgi:arylsulfatase A-like enzyme
MISGIFQCPIRAAAACLFLVLLCQACGSGVQPVDVVLDRPLVLLGEHLPAPSPRPGHDPPRGRLTINGEQRQVIQAHPPQVFRVRVVPGPQTRLLFGAAMDPGAWTGGRGDGVVFSVSITGGAGNSAEPLWERAVNPQKNANDRGWLDGDLDLAAWAGKPILIELRTGPGPDGDADFDWAVWSDPRLVSGRAQRDTHPENLILITADTLRADHLGCYGAAHPRTPHLDRLARSGAQFTRAWSQFNTTTASHCSIMTSLYGPSHGVDDNLMILDESRMTLAELLSAEGYFCGAVTSVAHLGPRQSGLGQGFRSFNAVEDERTAGQAVETAARWLERNGASPFFLWLHLFDPHIFYEPESEYLLQEAAVDCGDWPSIIRLQAQQRAADLAAGSKIRAHHWEGPFYMNQPMRDRLLTEQRRDIPARAYAGEVAYLDYCVGRLLALLGARGLEESTAVVFVADHGESLGEHEIYFDHRGLYDVNLQVPLLMRLPRIAGRKLLETNLVETVDIFPTCCQALGLAAPEGIQGQSLLPLLEGGAPGGLRGAVFAQHADSQAFAVSDGSWKLIVPQSDQPMITASGGDELYNLTEDPGEIRNLLREHPEQVARLTQMLQRWMSLTTRDDLPGRPELPLAELEKRKEKLKALGYLE